MSHGVTVIILDDKTDKILVLLFKYKPLAGGRSKASGQLDWLQNLQKCIGDILIHTPSFMY